MAWKQAWQKMNFQASVHKKLAKKCPRINFKSMKMLLQTRSNLGAPEVLTVMINIDIDGRPMRE